MHRSAGWGVRVGNEGGKRGVGGAGVEHGFEASGGALEIVYGADLRREGHKDSMEQCEAV